ncbi:DUF2303 family protein [Streptomyces sp. NPDC059015]|uniref:DUF2303 family protein n=1 Tax=unclassified Streptomyces TaxID=2593676 RepID=UPI00368E5256
MVTGFNRYDHGMPPSDKRTEFQAVIDVAQRAAHPAELELGKFYTLVVDGQVHRVDLTGPEHTGKPARKKGTTIVRDVDSFLAYFDKHGDDHSEVYADVQRRTITAVLDAHTGDGARWAEHRVELHLRHTAEWDAWTGIDNELLAQDKFAEFIEDNLPDLVEPDSATMLELAESFEATSSAEFKSSQRLDSGARTFAWVEETNAKAGHRGDITIPASLKLALRPFEGCEPFAVTARFRYRIKRSGDSGASLLLGIKLERPGDILAAAFEDVRTAVDNGIPETIAVLNGAPASR